MPYKTDEATGRTYWYPEREVAGPPKTLEDGELEYPYQEVAGPPEDVTPPPAAPAAAAAAGGFSPVAAAGLSAASGLFTELMRQQAAREQQKRDERFRKEMDARDKVAGAMRDNVTTAGNIGQAHQGALNQLLGVLSRSAR